MTNPYAPRHPPEDDLSKNGDDRRSPSSQTVSPWPTLMFLVGLMSLVGTSYFVYLAVKLRIDYPGLQDSSAMADAYWPKIFHDIYLLLAGLLAVIAVILFVLARVRRDRPKHPHKSKGPSRTK